MWVTVHLNKALGETVNVDNHHLGSGLRGISSKWQGERSEAQREETIL